jgi:hypothetical protein
MDELKVEGVVGLAGTVAAAKEGMDDEEKDEDEGEDRDAEM